MVLPATPHSRLSEPPARGAHHGCRQSPNQAHWRARRLPVQGFTFTCCAMPAAMRWPIKATTRGPFRIGSAIERSNTPPATLKSAKNDSKSFGAPDVSETGSRLPRVLPKAAIHFISAAAGIGVSERAPGRDRLRSLRSTHPRLKASAARRATDKARARRQGARS